MGIFSGGLLAGTREPTKAEALDMQRFTGLTLLSENLKH